jgi:hypothetical protein
LFALRFSAMADTVDADLLAWGQLRREVADLLESDRTRAIRLAQLEAIAEAESEVPPEPAGGLAEQMGPILLAPAFDLGEIVGAQAGGAAATVMEATRLIMATVTQDQAQAFDEKWVSHFYFPAPEIMDQFNAAAPQLSEFLLVQDTHAAAARAFDDARQEAVFAAEYGTDAAAALTRVRVQQDYLASLTGRAAGIAETLEALGEPPSPSGHTV